jgi:acyl-CoA thioester hydrolase
MTIINNIQQSKNPTTHVIRVYVEDTDCYGIVYHSQYLCFLERARTEWFREKGYTLSQLQQAGIKFAIASANLQFLKSAKQDDKLSIKTKLARHKLHLLKFQQAIFNEVQECILKADIDVVSLNNNGEICRI